MSSGVNGRKIKFISYDDAYSPPKTVEHARKLLRRRVFCSSTWSALWEFGDSEVCQSEENPHVFISSGDSR